MWIDGNVSNIPCVAGGTMASSLEVMLSDFCSISLTSVSY